MNLELFIIERINQLCKDQNISKYRLSKLTGISQSALSQMEKKQAALSIITIDKICTAFGITLSQFFSPSSPYPDLTPEQTEVLKNWDCLDSRKKAYLLSCMKLLRDM